MKSIENTLENLGIAPSAQLVYISLLQEGEATALTISKRTQVTRTSVYDQIRELRNKSLVSEREVDGKTFFVATDTKNLENMLDEKIESLVNERSGLEEALSSLSKEGGGLQPRVRFFEGKDGVRQMMKDILWYDDHGLSIFWPYKNMLAVLDEEFLQWFNEKRIKRCMDTKVVWPESERTKDHIFSKKDDFITRKYAPKEYMPDMGFIIYENKTAFISSSKEAFGFIVDSKEFAKLKHAEFSLLWNASKK